LNLLNAESEASLRWEVKIDEMMNLNQRLQINPTIVEFDGGHEINMVIRSKIAFG